MSYKQEENHTERSLVPALILGSSITALGAVRSLGRAGIPLHVVSPAPAFLRASRWYVPPPHGQLLADFSRLPDYLRGLPIERAVLIPTSDHAVIAIANLPPDLAKKFPASQVAADMVSRLIDKQEFGLLLDQYDVPRPQTIAVTRADDHHLISDQDIERFFIKPRDSQAFSEFFGVKALRPSSRAELQHMLSRALSRGFQVVLQKYIPGPPTNHYFLDGFYDKDGVCRAQLTRRRLRMSPPDFGNSCATISIPPPEAAAAASTLARLLGAIKYRGPYDAEFKQDESTGIFHLIELNIRPWWQAEFAVNCGIDAVTMCYRDALGFSQKDVKGYKIGKQWLMPFEDLASWVRLIKRGEMNFTNFRKFLDAWLESQWAGYAMDDPLPGVVFTADLFSRAAKRIVGGNKMPEELLLSPSGKHAE